MRYRKLGKTGLEVSEIGFGCGAIGGLMIKGERPEMVRVVARAIELGVTYFDTASAYGDGVSEQNVGWVLEQLKPEIVLGTKVNLQIHELDDIKTATLRSVENSLRRLKRDRVDLIQLHNGLCPKRSAESNQLDPSDLPPVIEAFEELIAQGKAGHWGINGLGDPATVKQAALDSGAETIQSMCNLLNPGSGWPVPAGFPYVDYDLLINAAADAGIGVIAIRVLAGGAMTGSTARHAIGAQSVNPIGTSDSLAVDARHANRFRFLIKEGVVDSLVEAAICFDLSHPGICTAMVGISEMSHLEQAVAAANKGPLPQIALDRLPAVWASLEE